MEGAGLWLAMLMLLFVQPLFVEAAEQQVAHGSGQLHFRGDQGRKPAPVLATDYQVKVAGLLAETRLRQRFGSNSNQWQEGVYTFPLPENATVHAMTLTTAERVVGEIREREEARREYEAAGTLTSVRCRAFARKRKCGCNSPMASGGDTGLPRYVSWTAARSRSNWGSTTRIPWYWSPAILLTALPPMAP
jgi:hypothetical protein